MIEYAATFFALGYLYYFLRWTFKRQRTHFLFCLLLGILACLTKITSFVLPLLVVATIGGLQLARVAFGLGGRGRRAASASERARAGVTRALRQAIARIGQNHPRLGEHLGRTIRTGTYCAYVPDPRAPAVTRAMLARCCFDPARRPSR